MSQQDVELVEAMLSRFHAGDGASALACFSEDVLVEAPARPDVGKGKGREAVGALVGSWLASWENWTEEINEVRDLGDRVLVISTQRGYAKSTGIETSMQYALLYETRDGEISKMGLYGDADEALEAAGPQE